MEVIPFNRPAMSGKELDNIQTANDRGVFSGDGPFSERCANWLKQSTGCHTALLTHSCTAALEMAAILLDIAPGDEIIMPSYTFVATASAFVLRGGVPVFVDIRPDTLNIDESLIESAITPRTQAICVVHYAGVAGEMDAILDIAKRHGLAVVEDAAQGLMASYRSRALGSIGTFGAFSFHETKNVTCGEGGALLVNTADHVERAHVVHQKGTDRTRFKEGRVDKYSWQDLGSSFHLGELAAAFLSAQLDAAQDFTARRLDIWQNYHQRLEPLESAGVIRRPIVPHHCNHNAHMYYILLEDGMNRADIIAELDSRGVNAVFHYIPLQSSPAGLKHGKTSGTMGNTDRVSQSILRLPLWVGMNENMIARIASALSATLGVKVGA